jgi:hypothetical protein
MIFSRRRKSFGAAAFMTDEPINLGRTSLTQVEFVVEKVAVGFNRLRRKQCGSFHRISVSSQTNRRFMKILKPILCLLIFAAIVPAQQESAVPLATDYYLLGGSQNGKWLTAEAVAPTIGKKTDMVFVNLNGVAKGRAVLNNTGEDYGACPENKMMRLEPETESAFAVGANAGWNIVPRAPQLIAVTDKDYRKIAADFLRTKGIARTKISLSQIVQIDLEGDGQAEVLITGNFYKKEIWRRRRRAITRSRCFGGKPPAGEFRTFSSTVSFSPGATITTRRTRARF